MNLPQLEYDNISGALRASDGNDVGHTFAWDGDSTDEDMREIARRCNAHDALVAALRDVESHWAGVRVDDNSIVGALLAKVRAALAQAEGAK